MPAPEPAAALTFEEKFPVINGTFLDGTLVYHCLEKEFTRRYNAAGERLLVWSEDVVQWEVRTHCGVLLDWWTRETDSKGNYTTLRRDYADAIARPCKRCFGEATS